MRTTCMFIRTIALAAVALTWLHSVIASSAPPRPLKRVAHPSVLALEILPRRSPTSSSLLSSRSLLENTAPVLRHTDSLRLTLAAFSQVFHLHLRPNENLIHSSARINYYYTPPDGSGPPIKYKTEPLLREAVNAYWGEVVRAESSARRISEDAAGGLLIQGGGQDRGDDLGWARIVVHDQGDQERGVAPVFEGAFSVHGVVYHVSTLDNYLLRRHPLDPDPQSFEVMMDSGLVIFRDEDVMSPEEEDDFMLQRRVHRSVLRAEGAAKERVCAHDALPFNVDAGINPVLRVQQGGMQRPGWYDPFGILDPWSVNESLRRRDDVGGGSGNNNFSTSIGSTDGCVKSQKIIYMGVAADCQYTSLVGSTQNATRDILTNWNTASALYKKTFNVSLGIVEIDMNDGSCPTTPDPSKPWNVPCSSASLNERLSLFSSWRGQKGNDGTGLWHLMSGCPTGTEVGVAWLGTLCRSDATGTDPMVVSGTAVSTFGRTEWQVIAHEIGHNFGAIHDCDAGCPGGVTCCPLSTTTCDANAAFLMSPTSSSTESVFSQCTIGNICTVLGANSVNSTCLQDPDPTKQTLSLQMCGNGIVEVGEDCDPGLGTTSLCCDSATCKFTAGAVCDPSNQQCCTNQCSFSSANTVCRPAANAICDKPEFCTGTSGSCPADVTAPNGLSCGANGLMCAQGQCTSPDQQCQNVGGSMNLTKACPQQNDKSCQIACQDPTHPNQCVVLQALLVNGSPCGYGGSCDSGVCKPGSLFATAKAWYLQNLQYSIPVTVVVVIVIIATIYGLYMCIRRNCCARSFKRSPIYNPRDSMTPALLPPQPLFRQSSNDKRPPLFPSSSSSTLVAIGGPGKYVSEAPAGMFDDTPTRLGTGSSMGGKLSKPPSRGTPDITAKRVATPDFNYSPGPRLPPLAFTRNSAQITGDNGGFGDGLLSGIPSFLRPGSGRGSATATPTRTDMRNLMFEPPSTGMVSSPGPAPKQFKRASTLAPQDRTPYPYVPSGATVNETMEESYDDGSPLMGRDPSKGFARR